MPSQKLENLLNLALQATTEEKEKSSGLATGYNPVARTWELYRKIPRSAYAPGIFRYPRRASYQQLRHRHHPRRLHRRLHPT